MRKKTRKLRRLTIDVPKFLADYNDAASSDMTVRDFCEVTGLHIATLHSRIETLASRGVILPLLKGMRKKTRMGKRLGLLAPAPRKVRAAKTTALIVHPDHKPDEPEAAPLPTFSICVGNGF